MSRPFRLALPSKGRLHAPALELARAAGLAFELNGRALHSHCSQWDVDVLLARADDIPAWLADGAVEAAVAGRNQLVEHGGGADELASLGFGRCTLAMAVPEDGPMETVEDLAGRRIATSYPRTTRDFLRRRGIPADVLAIQGSVELAPRLGAADAVCDLVSTGETLRQNGLRPLEPVLESEAVLLARPGLDESQAATARELATVVRSVVAARGKRYLMLNAPDGSLDAIVSLLPGLDSPTVLPLAAAGMHAVHAVVPSDAVIDLLEPLKRAGARSLLVMPIDHLIP